MKLGVAPPRGVWTILAGMALALGACGERIHLPAGDHLLTYTCGAVRPQSASQEDRAAVKAHALELLRSANEAGEDATARTMVGALASGAPDTVERELVRMLCAHPAWRDRAGVRQGSHFGHESAPEEFELTLPLLPSDGTRTSDIFRLSDLRGRWVYLGVFGSWCTTCREEYPSMARLAGRFQEAGGGAPVIVGLLLNDSPDRAHAFFGMHGGPAYPFAVLDQAAVTRWGITGAPMGFLIDPDGQLKDRCFGCQRGALSVDALERRFTISPERP